MRKFLLFLFFLPSLMFCQQNYLVEKLPSRIRFSGDEIHMKNEPNIGFVGHGYEVFGLIPNQEDIYFGVNSYAALTGIRSGFIVFGVSGGFQKQISNKQWYVDSGMFIGGGGGSGAPDGGGLMLRPHLDIQTKLNPKISVRAGISYITFPSGEINSLNATIGAVLHTHTFFAKLVNQPIKPGEQHFFKNLDVYATSSNLFNFTKGPTKGVSIQKNAPTISLLGATVKTHGNSSWYGVLKLGGAFVGEVDGFMMLVTGMGYELPVTKWLFVDAKALIGGAGGGSVDFGGGLATQLEVGLGIKMSDYLISTSFGKTAAPNGNFSANHLDVSIGKTFPLYYGNKTNAKESILSNKAVTKENFGFAIYNRTYVNKQGEDKLGRAYDKAFNLLGFEVEKQFNTAWSVLAATVWAYQGNYGAYAEGWLGMQYHYPFAKNWRLLSKIMLGAGGGGDINLGSGMIYQYGVGIHKTLNKKWSLLVNTGQVRPVSKGNFTPIFIDVGVKLDISQLVKK